MRVVKFSFLIILTFVLTAFFPPGKKLSLLVAEYNDNAAKNHLQYLVNYVFMTLPSRCCCMELYYPKMDLSGSFFSC